MPSKLSDELILLYDKTAHTNLVTKLCKQFQVKNLQVLISIVLVIVKHLSYSFDTIYFAILTTLFIISTRKADMESTVSPLFNQKDAKNSLSSFQVPLSFSVGMTNHGQQRTFCHAAEVKSCISWPLHAVVSLLLVGLHLMDFVVAL